MISRTNLISAAILASAALTSPFAFAADGTITITGTVTAQTCTIRGFLSGSSNFTVPLIKVSASSLPGAGKPAGATQFNISLSACTPASGNVHTYFEPGPTVDTATGNLFNTAANGAATNVEIQLLNSDSTPIKLGVADAAQNSKSVAISAAGTATLNYIAQYIATGAATPGAVSTSVLYTMVYQ
ncbi:fimbrial protein [Paraburkholderia edwinii]|jgi:major type 1 subunit fimbrin (pilin)|uniref:Fimbrial protein n=1 Tax=Paraburkholderia edwinii TaxID=2861782 RepID=A0ABX8UYH2_9BURK|nr:fimbrial protein [Paraburkholderia edwinii]QYD71918.1 fimbrial protein [Paraburkholderia edwinii]